MTGDGDTRPFNGKTLLVYMLAGGSVLSGVGGAGYASYRSDRRDDDVATMRNDIAMMRAQHATDTQRIVSLEANEVRGLEVRLNRLEGETQTRAQLFADVGEVKANLAVLQKQVEKMDGKLEKALESKP